MTDWRWGAGAMLGWVALACAGCVATGTIKGRLTDTGRPPQSVTLAYRSDRFAQNGMMTATMPNGEQFSGRYLQVTSETSGETLEPFWAGWSVAWNDWPTWSDEAWIAGADVPTFVQNYSGKVIALLLGDRGDKMRCRFRLANPAEGMSGGGVGQCEVSGGAKIEAEF